MANPKTISKAKSISKTAEDNPTGSNTPAASGTQTNKTKSPFLDSSQARDAYEESWRWYRVYFDPCDEFERIARNRPSPNIDPTLPRITDGTMAAIIQETPKRITQQIPSGLVFSKDNPEFAPIADIILREKLLQMYNRMGSLIQKVWNMSGKSMTYGVASSYTFFTQTNGKMHTDFIIPYVKDSFGERGKVYIPDSNFRFLRTWYTKRDLQAIINRETSLQKKIQGYTSPYDLKGVSDWMSSGAQAKPSYLMTPAEKEKGGETGGYEMIHVFQKGEGAEFYGFAPRFNKGANIYSKVNPDPRGVFPIDDQYCNIDLSNPLGRGQVELSGGIQNLMDQQMQLYQFLATIMQGPPLQVWGKVNKNSLKFRPNAIWDMGNSPNNKVEPALINDQQIQNFVTNMQFLAGKINNINATQDVSVSSQANNTSQSKTQAGVQQQQQRLGASDNYLMLQSEEWFRKHCETSLNLYFANMKGKEQIDVGEQSVKDLEATLADKYISQDTKGNTILKVNYDDLEKVILNFHVNAGTSKKIDDADQLQRLQTALQDIGQNGRVIAWYLAQEGKKLNVGDIYRQMLERMGLQNLDSILQDMNEQEKATAQQQPYPLFDMPKLSADYKDLPPSAAVGFLAGAGINVNPQEVMQQAVVDPNARGQAGATGAGNPADAIIPQLHPILQTIKAMGWQLDDLPVDAQNQVLQLMGLPGGMSPMALNAQTNAVKAAHDVASGQTKTALEVAKTGHQQGLEMHKAAMENVMPWQYQAAQTPPASDPDNDSDTDTTAAGDTDQDMQPPTPPSNHVNDINQHYSNAGLTPQEQGLCHQLIRRGFSDADCEQAIVMLRQGMPLDQVIQTIGAKHAAPAR